MGELEEMRIPEVGTAIRGISALSAIVKDIRLKRKDEEKLETVWLFVSAIYSVKFNLIFQRPLTEEATSSIAIENGSLKRKVPADVRRHVKKRKHSE